MNRRIHFLLALFTVGCIACSPLAAETLEPTLDSTKLGDWQFVEGKWSVADGVVSQSETERLNVAILKEPVFKDFRYTAEFKIHAAGTGVRAAAFVFRASGSKTFYWLHLDSKNGNAILTRSNIDNPWIEIARRPCKLEQDQWQSIEIRGQGPAIEVSLNGQSVLQATDSSLESGRIGVGTSEGHVSFRKIKVEGSPISGGEPLRIEQAPYQVISRGDTAGPYQSFPDACRLPNGDIACVFYAGYGHISLPNQTWPRGGRICIVRSKDEGQTWSQPEILFDGPLDDRDPHLAAMQDGTLHCTFFTYEKMNGREVYDTCLVSSTDGGATWGTEAKVLAPRWAVSAPIRELADGTRLLGIYTEANKTAFGGVLRSTDQGKSWSEPIPIDPQSGVRLDAETDLIQLKDGSVLAALRGDGKVPMHYSHSRDGGLTWSGVKDIGFLGHCPHLTRLSNGDILLTHRIPNTSMHVSHDDGQTWNGPILIDSVIGAYPATVELKDKSVLIVYYEEGVGSAVRAVRFRLVENRIEKLPWAAAK